MMQPDFTILTKDQEREAWERMKGGDLAGRFALIESGMPYARRLATDYCRRTGWDDYDEATQEAYVKLITLVDRYFDPNIGRLTTLMSATVPHWLRDQHLRSRLIALPRNASSWSNKTRDMVLRLRKIFSVNAPVGDDGDEWQIADYRTPEERLADLQDEIGDIRRRIAYAKSQLEKRDLRIFEGRLEEDLDLHDLGDELGISRERVRQLQVRAEDRFRRAYTTCPREWRCHV